MSNETIYARVERDLNGRQSRKVANNTYLQRRDQDTIALLYHATDIVKYHANGDVILDTAGWKTSTTKLRFNEHYSRLPIPRFWSERGVWFFKFDGQEFPYEDGLRLYVNGDGQYHIDMSTIGEDPKKTQKLRRKVKAFAQGYVSSLKSGNVPAPSLGDCMFCSVGLRTADKQTLGEASKDHGHIMLHMEERYYVPSLVVRAMEVMPCSQAMKWAVQGAWNQTPKGTGQEVFERISGSMPDFVWPQITKMLARYVMRQLGLAA